MILTIDFSNGKVVVAGPDGEPLPTDVTVTLKGGGKGEDVLIGARVTLDNDLLRDVRDVWTNGASYEDRVSVLTGSGSLLEANVTVQDDGDKDKLKGAKDRDLFFADLSGSDKDKVKGQKSNEDLFELL